MRPRTAGAGVRGGSPAGARSPRRWAVPASGEAGARSVLHACRAVPSEPPDLLQPAAREAARVCRRGSCRRDPWSRVGRVGKSREGEWR